KPPPDRTRAPCPLRLTLRPSRSDRRARTPPRAPSPARPAPPPTTSQRPSTARPSWLELPGEEVGQLGAAAPVLGLDGNDQERMLGRVVTPRRIGERRQELGRAIGNDEIERGHLHHHRPPVERLHDRLRIDRVDEQPRQIQEPRRLPTF